MNEQEIQKEKIARSKKQMMWFSIASIVMMFAGLSSAYIVSSGRDDWVEVPLPEEFFWSTAVIIASSLCLFAAKKMIQRDRLKNASLLTLLSFVLGAVFVGIQFVGFSALVEEGFYFTGASSNVNASYIYILVLLHIVHIVAGLIVLIVLCVNTLRRKYSAKNMLGFDLGSIFWHFVDVLWIYLLLFFMFANEIF